MSTVAPAPTTVPETTPTTQYLIWYFACPDCAIGKDSNVRNGLFHAVDENDVANQAGLTGFYFRDIDSTIRTSQYDLAAAKYSLDNASGFDSFVSISVYENDSVAYAAAKLLGTYFEQVGVSFEIIQEASSDPSTYTGNIIVKPY